MNSYGHDGLILTTTGSFQTTFDTRKQATDMDLMQHLIENQKIQHAASLLERARRAKSFRVLHPAAPELAEPVRDFESYRLPFIPAQAFRRVVEDDYLPLEPEISGTYAVEFVDELIRIALGTMTFYYDENGELTTDPDYELFDEFAIHLSTLKALMAVRDDLTENDNPLKITFNS